MSLHNTMLPPVQCLHISEAYCYYLQCYNSCQCYPIQIRHSQLVGNLKEAAIVVITSSKQVTCCDNPPSVVQCHCHHTCMMTSQCVSTESVKLNPDTLNKIHH